MVLTARKAAKYKNVLRRPIAAGHKLKGRSLSLNMVLALRKSEGRIDGIVSLNIAPSS